MLSIRYSFNVRDEILLTSKEDLMDENSALVLDDLDALALTFGGPLSSNLNAGGDRPRKPIVETEWDPYAPERMIA